MNRPLLDRSAAVAMTGGGSANSKSSSSSIIPTAAAAPGETFHATPAKHSGGGSLDNFDLLKSSLPVLKQEPTSKEDSKNDHNTCANNSNTSNNPKSSPFSFRLADETSRRIDQILLRRSSSTPATTSPCTTTAGAIVSATATAERPSVHVQKHVYRRAAERLGLRIRKTKKNSACTTPNESAVVNKRQATDTDNKDPMQNPMKKKRRTVTFRPTATLSTIERIAPSESEAMHRTSEESRRDRDRTIQNARDLRHLCQLYSHEDVGTIRSLAQCLQIDTCVRGVEHYLSQEVYEGRRRAALRVIDTVLQTQAQYQQRLNDHVSQQNGGQPGPTFVDAMTNDIALASASLSRGAAIDAMDRAAEDEAATKT